MHELMNLRVNPEFKKYLREHGIPLQEGVGFAILFYYRNQVDELENYLINKNLIDLEKCTLLLDRDEVTGDLKLRIPVFALSEKEEKVLERKRNSTFAQYYNGLVKSGLINEMGHLNNPQDYAVINNPKDCEDFYNELNITAEQVKDAIKATIAYYRNSKPALKLSNYIKNSLAIAVKTYAED